MRRTLRSGAVPTGQPDSGRVQQELGCPEETEQANPLCCEPGRKAPDHSTSQVDRLGSELYDRLGLRSRP